MLRKHEQSLNVYMFHGGTSWGFSQGSCVFKQKFSYVRPLLPPPYFRPELPAPAQCRRT